MKQRWASTSLQMRDEFQGCNGHDLQSHLKQASHFLYNIVSMGSGTCKQTFLPYAQNINFPRLRDIWYTSTLVDTTAFLKLTKMANERSKMLNKRLKE